MASVGAAAARGLESGLGLGLQLQNQQQQQEDRRRRIDMEIEDRQLVQQDRQRRQRLQDDQLAQQRTEQGRAEEDRALQALESQLASLRAQGEAMAGQYGGQVPPEVATRYQQQVQAISGQRDELLRGRYEPVVRRRRQQMADVLSRIQTDPAGVRGIPDADFYSTMETALRRDPRELLGAADGQPSRVHVAVSDIVNGLQTGNEGMTLRGANVLLEPELRTGIGQPSPHGGVIVGKRIESLVPHPQNPGEFTPMLRVYVGDGKIDTKEEEARAAQIRAQDPDAPPNATGYYLAPVTQNRSTDPADPVQSISVEKAMDYAGRVQTLAQLLTSEPELRGKLERGAAAAAKSGDGVSFLEALSSIGGKMPAPRKISRERVDLGGEVLERTVDDSGRITAEQRMPKSPAPSAKGARGAGGDGSGGGAVGLPPRGGATGEAVLQGLSAADADIVRGLANGSIVPNDISTKGNRRERMLALAKQFDPTADLSGRKRENEKPFPAKERQLLIEARTNASTINSLLSEFKDDYASKGVLGMGTDLAIRAKSVLGIDKGTVQWWKNYRKMAELVERHAMFGAALTATEQGSWRSADIDPGMDADVIRANLNTRAALAQKVLEATQQDLIDSGYSPERVQKIGGRDVDTPMDGRSPGGVSGSWDPPEQNAKGWRLMVDEKGNRAYVSPDGKQFEEVR